MDVPNGGGTFEGYVDLVIREKSTGFVFLVDFKVRASLLERPEEDYDQQMALYQFLLGLQGIQTMGSIIYQIKSSIPKKPSLNKNGTMSRSEISSDWDTYRSALIDANLEPSDYLDMREKLSEKQFQKPIKTYRTPETVIAFWENAVQLVREIQVFDERSTQTIAPRSFNQFNCPSCGMKALCRAEFENQPTDHLFVNDFKMENKNDQ